MKQKRLARAVSLALGAALTAGAGQALAHMDVYYNAFVGASDSATDGWNYGGIGNPLKPTVSPGWYMTPGSNTKSAALPLGYSGAGWLNWAVEIHPHGSSTITGEVSKANAAATYDGAVVDLDTNKGSYHDFGNSFGTPQGWAHNTDIGLLKVHDQDMYVTLTITNDEANPSFSNFGITVFEGMDQNTGFVNHHDTWNCPTCTPAYPFTSSTPFGMSGLTYKAHTDVLNGQFNTLTFLAEADKVYSVFLGGAQAGSVFFPTNDYKLSISATPVPLPAAGWLLGGALAALGLYRRKSA
ncbi:MAG: VPLPA-CTERM sorting domain-containing protein [Methylohalobius sp.]|nr:VPLPA-CTERM sorting domain-containing protein [Methylohalobius sp.]